MITNKTQAQKGYTMVKSIIDKVIKELNKKNYMLDFDGAYDWVLTPSQRWFELYENGAGNLIFIYDEFDNLIFISDDVCEIIEFIEVN